MTFGLKTNLKKKNDWYRKANRKILRYQQFNSNWQFCKCSFYIQNLGRFNYENNRTR